MSNIPEHTHTYDKVNANTGSHTLTIAEMPNHSHGLTNGTQVMAMNASPYELIGVDVGNNFSYFSRASITSAGGGGGHTHPISTTSTNTGSSGSTSPTAISVEDPYITVYMWRRTA